MTKAFVVLVTVLSVLLVALIVPFVAQTNELQGQITTLKSEAQAASSRAQAAQADKTEILAQQNQQTSQLNNQLNALTAKRDDLQAQLQQAQAQADAQRSSLSELKANYATLAAANQQYAQILDKLNTQLDTSQKSRVQLAQKNLEVRGRLNELQASNDSLTQQFRQVKETAQAAREETQRYADQIASLPENVRKQLQGETGGQSSVSNDELVSNPETPINGQVTGIDTDSGTTFVQINVGNNDGVQGNMKFLIYRGNQFLGNLVVTQVDADRAVGRIQLSRGQVQQGDTIYAGPTGSTGS